MTLASAIITDAFRESNLIPVGQSPTANQQAEALTRLNVLLASTVGNEAGDGLNDLRVGGAYDESSLCSQWVPDNARLILNLTIATTFNLDPYPYDGQRLAFVDVAGNLGTYNLTLSGNGRRIEGLTSVVLNTNSDARQYIFRADTGNWVKLTTLVLADALPFPTEFDDYFVTMLAMRINPRYSQAMTTESGEALKRARSQLRARYNGPRQVEPDVDLRGGLADPKGANGYTNPNEFNTGRPWPYL
jgi:hypothetical protein